MAIRKKPVKKAAPKPTRKGVPISGGGDLLSGDASVSSVLGSGGPGTRVADMEVYWMLATKHPWISSCITLIADAVSSEGYQVSSVDDNNAAPLDSKDSRIADIKSFFSMCFPHSTERAARNALAADLNAYGVGYWHKKRVGKLIVALERLDPRTVTGRLNAEQTAIEKYLVRTKNLQGIFDMTKVVELDADDVILFTRSGGDPITGPGSPMEALDLTAACDMAARRQRESYFRNGCTPGLILSNQDITPDQTDAAEQKLRKTKAGADNAYKTMILAGTWKVDQIARSGRDDADFVKASALNREDVCSVYKVPVGMLTFSGSALGGSGKGEDRDFFEEFAVLPLEELIYERITISLLNDEWEMEDIRLLPKRRSRVRTARFDSAALGVKFGMTGNEVRALVGAPPITDPLYAMDVPLFIGATGAGGFSSDEGLAAPVTTQNDGSTPDKSNSASADANAAETHHDSHEQSPEKKSGVARKGARPFRIPRFGY